MKFTVSGYFFPFILSVAILATFTSCLPDNNGDSSRSEVRVVLDFENANNVMTAGGDSLVIGILKFIHGNSFFSGNGDTLLLKESPEILIHQNGQNSAKILAAGIVRDVSLNEITFNIEQAPPTVQNIDSDFIRGDTLYSMVIEGFYQDSAFTFKSTRDFSATFELAPPLEAESNSFFEIILVTDVSSWFINEDGSLIDPRDSTGVAAINDNIEGSFRLENVERF
ncbi:MAG TPA: hypothetical protein VF181_02975 [Balneolaceae bacterium]